METKLRKTLISMIIFMVMFSNFGFTIKAIATSDEFQVISNGFFRKDEVKFSGYFENEDGKQKAEVISNAKDRVTLKFNIKPQVEGYLKTGFIRAVPTDGGNLNFRFVSIKNGLDSIIEDETFSSIGTEKTLNKLETIDKEENKNEETSENIVQTTDTVSNEVKNENLTNELTNSANTNTTGDVTNNVSTNTTNEIENSISTNTTNEIENSISTNTVNEIENSVSTNDVQNTIEIPQEEEEVFVDEEEYIKQEQKQEVQENNEKTLISSDIKILADNEIGLSNILEETTIEVEIEFNQNSEIVIDDLYKQISFRLTGGYINKKLEVVEVAKEQLMDIGWKYSKDIEVTSEYTKFSPFKIGTNLGIIAENKIVVARNIEDSKYLPIKNTNLEITVPTFNGKKPITADVQATKLMATKGQDSGYVEFTNDNWSYDQEKGKIIININNENNGKAQNSLGEDEYIIIYRFDEYTEEDTVNLDRNLKVTVEEYSAKENNIITKTISDTKQIKTNKGELITYSISTTEDKINKAKIYANYNSDEAPYEAEYTSNVRLNVLTSDMLEELKIDSSKEFFIDKNGLELEASGIKYKKIKFNYNDIKTTLEKGGAVEIYSTDGTLLYTLTKDLVKSQDDCTINMNNEPGVIIEVKNVSANGKIDVEITKAIGKPEIDKSIFINFRELVSRVTAEVKYANIEEKLALPVIGAVKEFEESYTKATLSINKPGLTTMQENENVELKIELNNNSLRSDLYINPTFELVYPKHIKEVNLESINVIYENGLVVKHFETYRDGENLKTRVELEGTQTSFIENTMSNGTNIIINARIKIDEYTPKKDDQIKLYYYNEGVSNYQAQTMWKVNKEIPNNILKQTNGFDVALINYQAPTGLIAINGIRNYDGAGSELRSVKQGEMTAQIPRERPMQNATMDLLALNNTGNECSDVVMLGRVPFEGSKDVISGQETGANINVKLVGFIQEDSENSAKSTIYYSARADANKNLEDPANGWTTDVEDITKVKSFLIVVDGKVEPGAFLKYTYGFEIPENLPYEANITGSFGVYYNNITDVAVIYESMIADKVGLTTEAGPKLEATMSVNVGNGTEVGEYRYLTYTIEVKNTGSIVAENPLVTVDIPEYTMACEKTDSNGLGNNQYLLSTKNQLKWVQDVHNPGTTEKIQFVLKTTKIPTIEEYNSKLLGYEVLNDEKGYYYIEKTSVKKENNNSEVKEEIIETKKYIDLKPLPDFYVSCKAVVKAENLGITTETNLVKNKIKNSKFDFVVNTETQSPLKIGSSMCYTASVKNISKSVQKNVKAVWTLPSTVEFVRPENDSTPTTGTNEGWTYDEQSRTATKIFNEIKPNETVFPNLKFKIVRGNAEEQSNNLTFITEDGKEEKSSDIKILYTSANIRTSQNTNIAGGTVLEGNNVEFIIEIKNIGNNIGDNIVIYDEISPNLINPTAKLSGSQEGNVEIKDGKIECHLQKLITNGLVSLSIKGQAADLNGQEKSIINKARITYNINESIETNEIKLNIQENKQRKEEIIQKNKEEAEKQKQKDKANSTANKPQTEESSRKEETSKDKGKTLTKYNISGRVWVDKDRNGIKDEKDEWKIGTSVKLYKQNKMIKSTSTDGNGKYTFANVEQGEYVVIFEYDENKYIPTGYQKQNVEELNSNAVETSAGNASTNIIKVSDRNIENINLGLQEKEKFDLSIDKFITKATVTTGKKEEENQFNDLKLGKIEIRAKDLKNSTVDIEYKIKVTNTGDVEGKATTIADILPNDTSFDRNKNKDWVLGKDGILYNNSLKDINIKPGESKELKLVLTKKMTDRNTGVVSNKVQLSETSTTSGLTDNFENNVATQELLIGVKTGYSAEALIITIVLITGTIIIINISKGKILIGHNNYKNKQSKSKENIFKKMYK